MTALERQLGRTLTPTEAAIAAACGQLQALAFICIDASVPLATAERLAAYMAYMFEMQAEHAASLAADLVKRQRAARGESPGRDTTH